MPDLALGARPEPATVTDFQQSFEFSGGAGVPRQLVESARVDARAVGYAQGWAQGLREAAATQAAQLEQGRADRAALLQSQSQEVSTAVLALLRAADGLSRTSLELTDQIADTMLAAAIELAEALLGQELADPETSARSLLTRVLAAAPLEQSVTVRVSPADYATLTGPDAPALLASVDPTALARLSFESDPTLAPGDAMAKAAATSIDARLDAALQRLREYAG